MTTVGDRIGGRFGVESSRLDLDLVELSLLVPQWQVDAIELAAHGRGLTTGQMLRRLISTYCATLPNSDC